MSGVVFVLAEARSAISPHALLRADPGHEVGVYVSYGHALGGGNVSDTLTKRVKHGGSADELMGASDEATEYDVHAVVECSGGIVQVASVFASREVRAAVDVHDRTVDGSLGRMLREVRVVTDGQPQLQVTRG